MSTPSVLERSNLEAHVELCQNRYEQLERRYEGLDKRLDIIEDKVEKVHNDVLNGNKAMIKVFIGASATIIAGFLSMVIVIIEKMG